MALIQLAGLVAVVTDGSPSAGSWAATDPCQRSVTVVECSAPRSNPDGSLCSGWCWSLPR
jgi:hypothetical protein